MEAFFELEHTLESTLAAVQQPNASAQVRCLHYGLLQSTVAGMLILLVKCNAPLPAAAAALSRGLSVDAQHQAGHDDETLLLMLNGRLCGCRPLRGWRH